MKINTNLKKTKKRCENWFCEKRKECTELATDHHHLFPKTQQNRRRYGSLLDENFNILDISNRCHLNKSIPTYSEIEFRRAAEAEGFILPPASKSLQFKNFDFGRA